MSAFTSPFGGIPIHVMKMKNLLIQIFKRENAGSALPLHVKKPVSDMYTIRISTLPFESVLY